MTEELNPPEFDSWNIKDYWATEVCSHSNGELFSSVALRSPEDLLRDGIALPNARGGLYLQSDGSINDAPWRQPNS